MVAAVSPCDDVPSSLWFSCIQGYMVVINEENLIILG